MLCENKSHNPPYPIAQHSYHPYSCLIPLLLRKEVTVRISSNCITDAI